MMRRQPSALRERPVADHLTRKRPQTRSALLAPMHLIQLQRAVGEAGHVWDDPFVVNPSICSGMESPGSASTSRILSCSAFSSADISASDSFSWRLVTEMSDADRRANRYGAANEAR